MKTKPKSAAILTIKDAPRMTTRGRNRIATWLERQAGFLRRNAKQLSPRYTARYLYATLLAVTLTGCALFQPVAEGSRPEVVRAEQFAKQSFALVDSFMEWEAAYRATLGDDVKEFARRLEKDFPASFAAYNKSIRDYKALPTSGNLDVLQKSKLALQLIYDQLILYAPSDVEQAAETKAKTLKLD